MRIVARTDAGLIRNNNEDRVAFDADLGIAVLADGMGGQNAGEVASETAVTTVMEYVRRAASRPVGALEKALALANRRVHRLGTEHRDFAGMGTTLVAAVIDGADVVTAHAGDSRAYLFKGGRLACLTTDHSLVQQFVDAGLLTATQARFAANRHIVTRALGVAPEVPFDIGRFPFDDGDLLLLCSDGLTDMIDDEAILAACLCHSDPQALADALVASALEAGGFDNVSVIIVRR